ncbi:glycosyl transferase family 90-domain-containing protein [Bisporella sp. PMI_857]|nr:glycosyl transferase family 90-domain-containing protein [Bisporella sp. PMI_857]
MRRRRGALLSILAILALILHYSRTPSILQSTFDTTSGYGTHHGAGEPHKSLFLSEDQCAKAFLVLNKEIDNAVAQGPFKLRRIQDNTPGLVQGRIKNGKLYIISAFKDNALHRAPAVLHSLHRAIITSPEPLPDTIFALNINDEPRENTWSFAYSNDDFTPYTPWLMPHYSSWSWPILELGALDEVLARIDDVESETPWAKKIDKAVWRGTEVFNPDWSTRLRNKLVETANGKEWADIEASGRGRRNTIRGEEFCRYAYIVYAEGRSYSGRLPFHQACASVILTPPPTFLLHNTHLLRPIFSSVFQNMSPVPVAPPPESYPLNSSTTWPTSYPAHIANVVFVAPDWSDLEETITYLRSNPSIGRGIATRQRELMVGGGYLSEGAEACYWRSLIRAWSKMVRIEDESEWEEGMRWETFILLGELAYENI